MGKKKPTAIELFKQQFREAKKDISKASPEFKEMVKKMAYVGISGLEEFKQIIPVTFSDLLLSPNFNENEVINFICNLLRITREELNNYTYKEVLYMIKQHFKDTESGKKSREGGGKGREKKFGELKGMELYAAIQKYIDELIKKYPQHSNNQIYISVERKFKRKAETIKKYKLSGKIKIERLKE